MVSVQYNRRRKWMDRGHWGDHPCPHQDVGTMTTCSSVGSPYPAPSRPIRGCGILHTVHCGQMQTEYLLSYAFFSFVGACALLAFMQVHSVCLISFVGVDTDSREESQENTDLRLACLPLSSDTSCVSSWLIFKFFFSESRLFLLFRLCLIM